MRARLLVIALLCVGVDAAMAQEIYRWVDSAGQVHYGDAPPAGVTVERVAGRRWQPARGTDGRASEDPHAAATAEEPEAAATVEEPRSAARASLERRKLERRARQLHGELSRIDGELERLAGLRERHHKVSDDVRASLGEELLSEGELDLLARRKEIEAALHAVQQEFAALRAEVARQQGSSPAWWRELRTER